MPSTWKNYQLNTGEFRTHAIGQARFLIARAVEEWQVARLPGGLDIPTEGTMTEIPKIEDWTRWAAGDSGTSYTLSPGLPDLPLMASPRSPLFIPPGTHAQFFLRVPVTVEITVGSGNHELTLSKILTDEMFKTWHGTLAKGEVCYSLETSARRKLNEEFFDESVITCPFAIKNNQSADFHFRDLVFHTNSLSLYEVDNQIWSSFSTIKPAADLINAEIKVRSSPPKDIADAKPKILKQGSQSSKVNIKRLFGNIAT